MSQDVTSKSAQRSLDDIEDTIAQARYFAAAAASPILYLWGGVWVAAYGLCQFFPDLSGQIWAILCTLGGVGTGILSRNAPVRSESDARFGISWIILFAFAAVWFAVLIPWEQLKHFDYSERQRSMGAYGATLAMFAYVMMGLWWDRFFMWLGLAVTALTLVGYFAVPAYFNLWMAVFGGGLLLASGLLIKRRWKSQPE